MNFTLSTWPGLIPGEKYRKDIKITSLQELAKVFNNPKPIKVKKEQMLITRCWQKDRTKHNQIKKPPYLLTLDYDASDEEPCDVHTKLKDIEVNHFIFTTWTNKTEETVDKKNEGKNCFKVVFEVLAESPDEAFGLTKALASLVGKESVKRADDISTNIFAGGTEPSYIDQFEFLYYDEGRVAEKTKRFLLNKIPVEKKIVTSVDSDLEMFNKHLSTVGQKYSRESLETILKLIKYEEALGKGRREVWLHIGMGLHSTGDDSLLELWDKWSLENCSEFDHYDYAEMETNWNQNFSIDKSAKALVSLGTVHELAKHFIKVGNAKALRNAGWTFFNKFAEEEPEPVNFLINDLIVEGTIGFLVGEGGVGKSTLSLEIAKAISSGLPLFNVGKFGTTKGTVALINKEDGESKIWRQVRAIAELDATSKYEEMRKDFDEEIEIPEEAYVVSRKYWENVVRPDWSQNNVRLSDGNGESIEVVKGVIDSLKVLQQQLKELKKPELKLLILDPLALWHGGDENSSSDISQVFSALQKIQAELEITILVIHHKNKSGGYSGSHTIRDLGRFMLNLQFDALAEGKIIDLYVDKHNEARAKYTALKLIRTDNGLLKIAKGYEIEDAIKEQIIAEEILAAAKKAKKK